MKNAFSIIELLIIIGILGLLMILLITVFISQSQYFDNEHTRFLLKDNINISLPFIKDLIIASDSILASHNIQGIDYTSDSDTIVLRMPSLDINNKTITSQYDYAVITKEENNIKIVLSPSQQSARTPQNRIIANYVSSLLFDYGNVSPNLAKTVLFTITVSKTTFQNQIITINRQARATLRNI